MARDTDVTAPDALDPFEPPATLAGIEQAIQEEFQAFRDRIGRVTAATARRVGLLLIAGQEQKKIAPGTFYPWAWKRFQIKERTVRNLMAHAKACEKEGRLLPYHPNPATVAGLQDKPKKSVEHYSAATFIEIVRQFFGGKIDLDPASSLEAQRTVRALRFYTKYPVPDPPPEWAGVDGINGSWRRPDGQPSQVFLNPPYGGEAGPFITKLVAEYEAGNVSEAIVLLNGVSITSPWFEPLYGFPYILTRNIKFREPGGKEKSVMPLAVIVYLGREQERGPRRGCNFSRDRGRDWDRFVEAFSRYGVPVESMDRFDLLYARDLAESNVLTEEQKATMKRWWEEPMVSDDEPEDDPEQ